MLALGVLALGVLVWRRRQPGVPTAPAVVLLVGALAVAGLMGRAANLGGEIRHPEIRGSDFHAAPASERPVRRTEHGDDDD